MQTKQTLVDKRDKTEVAALEKDMKDSLASKNVADKEYTRLIAKVPNNSL